MVQPTTNGGRGYYPDPNQKLYDQYGGKAKYSAALKARNDAKTKYANDKKPLVTAEKKLKEQLSLLHAEIDYFEAQKILYPNVDFKATILKKQLAVNDTLDKLAVVQKKSAAIDAKINASEEAFKKAKLIKGGSGGSNGNPENSVYSTGKTKAGIYYFNAPLIKSGTFLNKGQLPKMVSAGGYPTGDAYLFWTGVEQYGGKGTIQMDRIINNSATKAEAKKQADKNKLPFDDNLYGFKFQYNPTTINMSWSGMMGANPVYEMLNKDPAIPMSTNLFTGTVSFDIILNRIQDIALLNLNGTSKYGEELYGKGISVKPEELKDIVQKGTMYDLEYLFRTLHGWVGYANYSSVLNGKTHDPGWLPVRPVELHLGNKLRYRVRVSGLEVVHKIFSEKMVPLLSVVSITCNRYWDGAVGEVKK
jgi:hypothetical protein